MSKLYFTRAGAERILRQKQDLINRLQETQRQKGEAAQTGGNVWHDNFSFEQLERDEQQINRKIADLNRKMEQMEVVREISANTSRLRIGHVAVLEIDGDLKTFLIGGFEDSDPQAAPPVVSYLAPIVQPFIGEGVDFGTFVQMGQAERWVVLREIRLPEPERGGS